MTDTYHALDALLQARHSTRAFTNTPVKPAQISQIVAAARRVPSWCNAQPWQVIVTDPATTDAFRTGLLNAVQTETPKPDMPWPVKYDGIYADRRRTCGWQLYDAVGVEKGDRAASAKQMQENFALFGAPHVAIITSEADLGPYGAMDCGGFVTAFTLAAQSLGIATIAQAAVAAYAPYVRQFFDIPENRHILCAISFGYEDETHPANAFRTARADVDDIIDWRTS